MQTVFRANLSAANFPLVSDFMGRSIIVPQYDENYITKQRFSGDDPDMDKGIPQVYYLHNCMSTGQGFKSVAYNRAIAPAIPADNNFTQIIAVKDPSENKAFLAITSDAKVFLFTVASKAWVDITAAVVGWTGGAISFAYANGYTYVCFSLFNVYKVDIVGITLTPAVLAGITNNLIVGLTGAANYLILHDAVTVYWSSATNPEDFVPSLITGAGSGVPQDVNGKIVGCLPLNNGFAIYTTTNIVISSYSGNLQFPWIFKGASNSAGIKSTEQVSYDGDNGTNYAWTSAGLLKVASNGCTTIDPEVADFLSGRIFEDYDTVAKKLTTTYLGEPLLVKVAYIAARFLVLSYGMTTLTHALVFDTAFKRWGKLKINHVDCTEVAIAADNSTTWSAQAGKTWSSYAGTTWSEFTEFSNNSANAGRTIGFLQADGSLRIAILDYGNFSADAVFIIGKYQITRNQLCTMQGFDVENIDFNNTNFTADVMSTLDGKTIVTDTVPINEVTGQLVRSYGCRVSGVNHSLVFHGAFNLCSVILRMSRQGRR